jgi:hypothetical protein
MVTLDALLPDQWLLLANADVVSSGGCATAPYWSVRSRTMGVGRINEARSVASHCSIRLAAESDVETLVDFTLREAAEAEGVTLIPRSITRERPAKR